MLGGKVFKREYAVAAAAVFLAGALAVFSGGFLSFLHHYVNIIATGRSDVKVLGLLFWLFLIFTLPLFKAFRSGGRIDKGLLERLVVLGVVISLIGTVLSLVIIADHGLPLGGSFYAVSGNNFSFNSLAHTHVLKPAVSAFQSVFPNADAGGAWFYALSEEFGVSAQLLNFMFLSVLVILACLSFMLLIASKDYERPSEKLFYGVLTFVFLKNAVDGGFLNPEYLLTLLFLLAVFLKRPVWASMALPFLAVSGLLWSSDNFIMGIVLIFALYCSLALFSDTRQDHRNIYLAGGLIVFVAFLYLGSSIKFFGQDLGADIDAGNSYKTRLPAGKTAYFVDKKDNAVHSLIGENTDLGDFVKSNDVSFDSYDESVKIDGVNCRSGVDVTVLNKLSVIGLDPSLMSHGDPSGWIKYEVLGSAGGEYLSFKIDNCLPNYLGSILTFIKKSFPGKAAVMVTV